MVNFNFSYAPGTSLQQMVGFETAGRAWSALLTDNVTVNIYAGVSSSLPSNVIGGALPAIRARQSYSSVVDGLVKDATSADDRVAVQFLHPGSYIAMFNAANFSTSATTDTINLTSANAKALNLVGASSALDGVILLGGLQGSRYTWNYDYARSATAPANSLDFLSTAIHEIGHILGFVSGVDKPGWISQVDFGLLAAVDDYFTNLEDRVTYATPLDLFRYSDANLLINDLSYGSNADQSNKFFSIDQGMTVIASFATGTDKSLGGDGNQASHWKDGTLGVFDPTLAPSERLSISRTDLRALDAIGWNLSSSTGTPSINLFSLKSQAEQTLAQRLGVAVSSLYASSSTSATSLSSSQLSAVDTLLRDSQVYNWGTKTATRVGGTGIGSFTQVIELLQNQAVYSSFETLDDSAFEPVTASTSGSSAAITQVMAASVSVAALLPTGAPLPPERDFQELGQRSCAVKSALVEPLQSRTPARWKSFGADRATAEFNGSRSQSTKPKFCPVQDLSTVDVIDVLAL
jgi:hypothetical protein